MTTKTIVLALGILMAACSGPGLRASAQSAPSGTACVGGEWWGDDEVARYGSCASVDGDLVLHDVSSLGPLAALRRVDGALRIEHTTRLYSLSGLERLASVERLELIDNRGLISVSGLKNLEHAPRVVIRQNQRLSGSFGFLQRLNRTATDLRIERSAGLEAEGISALAPRTDDVILAAR